LATDFVPLTPQGETGGDSFCDAGCGVGTLAIPLAQRGANVRASDISESMAMEGKQRAGKYPLRPTHLTKATPNAGTI